MKKDILGIMIYPYPDMMVVKITRLSRDTLDGTESHFYRYSYLSNHIFTILNRFLRINASLQYKFILKYRENLSEL